MIRHSRGRGHSGRIAPCAASTVLLLSVCLLGCSLRKELPGTGDDAGASRADVGAPDVASIPGPKPAEDASLGSGGNTAATSSGGAGQTAVSGTGSGGSGGTGTGGVQGLAPDGAVPDGAPGDATGGTGRGLAETCSGGSDCASGYCSDGVCCDAACTGSCSTCNLSGFAGHCTPISAGDVAPTPHPPCLKMAASTCQQDGLCDGKGGCQLYPSGEVCAGGACSSTTNMSVTGSTCDGLGTCKPSAAVTCAPFKCKADGTGCASTCVTDGDCQGQPCVAGSCGKVANGNMCTSASQCTSGNCVDGYCCDFACAGSCQACNLTGAIGKCTILPANQTPRSGRAACVGGTCGSHCDGTSTSCAFAPRTTMCGTASCTSGMARAAVSCDGMGACPAAPATSCGGFACAGSVCKSSCAADTDCVGGTPYCSGGKCQATKPLGRACASGAECAGGNCVNGVCCSTSSCSSCQACNLNNSGTCSNRASGVAVAGCAATATNCLVGTCDGAGACQVAKAGTDCGVCKTCTASGTCASGYQGAQDPSGCSAACQVCGNGTCSSMTSMTCYQDLDGDGYGSTGVSFSNCGPCPAGSVTNNKDCNDDPTKSGAMVHPGQTGWFSVSNPVAGYDYDCSGVAEKQPNQLGPSNCGVTTATCSDASGMCIPTCTSSNAANAACNGACGVYSQPACGTMISVTSLVCAYAPFCSSVGGVDNGTNTNQACH